MSKMFYHVMQDNVGNLLFGVSGTMRIAGSGTLATIYGDEALAVPIANPMTNHPSFGSFKCFLGVGDYDFYMAKSGYTFETLTGVQGSGTMADQNASAVTITGGTATFTRLDMLGKIKVGVAAEQAAALDMYWDRSAQNAVILRPTNDVGVFYPLGFLNAAGTQVGSITQTGSAVAYNTTSDVRLKHAIAPLAGALDVVRALLPVRFRWRATHEAGVGFVAQDVAPLVPEAVTQLAGAEGLLQMDASKLLPYVVQALQEVTQRLEAVEARLTPSAAGA